MSAYVNLPFCEWADAKVSKSQEGRAQEDMAGAAGAEDVGDGMVLAAVPNGQHHEKLLIGRNRQRHTDSESGGFSASQLPDHRQAPGKVKMTQLSAPAENTE